MILHLGARQKREWLLLFWIFFLVTKTLLGQQLYFQDFLKDKISF